MGNINDHELLHKPLYESPQASARLPDWAPKDWKVRYVIDFMEAYQLHHLLVSDIKAFQFPVKMVIYSNKSKQIVYPYSVMQFGLAPVVDKSQQKAIAIWLDVMTPKIQVLRERINDAIPKFTLTKQQKADKAQCLTLQAKLDDLLSGSNALFPCKTFPELPSGIPFRVNDTLAILWDGFFGGKIKIDTPKITDIMISGVRQHELHIEVESGYSFSIPLPMAKNEGGLIKKMANNAYVYCSKEAANKAAKKLLVAASDALCP